ncbi:MAG TPA: alpha/beta fold hydrolase, partial [Candidatus Dormibacteraeota bacterium]|nr:alpha/beta fold hydrolase [Candidatus Dormibacteraeota bacterium]
MAIVRLAGGRRASYEVLGAGRPTLMLPGGPGFAAAYMRGDAELFADTLKSFLIDPHGSGDSTAPANPAEYTPEGHARFYEEVRQALGLNDVVVLGHSFGGTTALTYAALFPRHVERCVAVAAFGIGTEVDASGGGAADAAFSAMLDRHASAPWYAEARLIMDQWTDRILA